MEFIFHYLWPSLKVCFKSVFTIAVIGTIIILELAVVLWFDSWAIVALLIFGAIDTGIIRAWDNYTEDKERVGNGWLPKYRDK